MHANILIGITIVCCTISDTDKARSQKSSSTAFQKKTHIINNLSGAIDCFVLWLFNLSYI